MVAGGRKRKKKGKKRKEKKRRPDGSSRNYAAVPALNLVRKSIRYKKQEKKEKEK